jgi:hypothetical protein
LNLPFNLVIRYLELPPPTAIEFVPVMWVFWAWAGFTLAFFAIGAAKCRLNLPPLGPEPAGRDKLPGEQRAEAKFRDTYRKRFSWNELVYLVLANGAGGFLLYFANAGVLWAIVFFALACLWLIYDAASAPFAFRQMNPRLVETLDWVYFMTGAVAWTYCLACIASRVLGSKF